MDGAVIVLVDACRTETGLAVTNVAGLTDCRYDERQKPILPSFLPALRIRMWPHVFVFSICCSPIHSTDCVVAFAAMAGSQAYDFAAHNRNGSFTSGLLDSISSHGHLESVQLLAHRVRDAVVTATSRPPWPKPQVPWVSSSIGSTPRYLVQLGLNLPLHPTLAPGVTLGQVAGPLVAAIDDQVC
jgi:hypothetical protein